MKLRSLNILPLLLVLATYAACQNGPTPPSINLAWTQSVDAVTADCVYRGTATGVYSMPALFCSATPITSYNDTTVVRGTKYFYAVTAKVGAAETPYSNEVNATSPLLHAPTGLATGLISQLFFPPSLTHPNPITTASADGSLRAVAK